MSTRYLMARKLGRRVSKGEFERRTTAYNHYVVKQRKIQIGIDKSGDPVYAVRRSITTALMPGTARHIRKHGMVDHEPLNRQALYRDRKPAGQSRRYKD